MKGVVSRKPLGKNPINRHGRNRVAASRHFLTEAPCTSRQVKVYWVWVGPSTANHLRFVSTIPRSRPDLGVVAAGIRTLVVDGAQPALAIQVQAIVVAHPGQGEDPRLLVEA